MTPIQAVILGIVQGLTEFLPVSSSGHLVLVPWLLGWRLDPAASFVFDVLVHWGTLLAVVAYFWRDLLEILRAVLAGIARGRPFDDPSSRLGWLILAASFPAGLAGVLFKDAAEAAFQNPAAVSVFLLATAALLALSERMGRRVRELGSLGLGDSLWIGLAQAVALLPGISRSGATIAAGLTRGLKRAEAARFSFLMSLPVMLGAGLLTLRNLAAAPDAASQVAPLALGFAAAAVVGYLAIRWLLAFLTRRPLTIFALYCTAAGTLGLLLYALRA